jgi:methylated-DNA-protein-cysteine methyltransferase related protein
MKCNNNKVFQIVFKIPYGKVLTYKKLAEMSGINNPRTVGNVLHKNTDPEKFPCYKVIKSDGKLASNYAFGGKSEQMKRLKKEGIIFNKGKINLDNYLWK